MNAAANTTTSFTRRARLVLLIAQSKYLVWCKLANLIIESSFLIKLMGAQRRHSAAAAHLLRSHDREVIENYSLIILA